MPLTEKRTALKRATVAKGAPMPRYMPRMPCSERVFRLEWFLERKEREKEYEFLLYKVEVEVFQKG